MAGGVRGTENATRPGAVWPREGVGEAWDPPIREGAIGQGGGREGGVLPTGAEYVDLGGPEERG